MNPTKDTCLYNALFIICPFCQLEHFLQSKFGDKIYFHTVAGGVLNFQTDDILVLLDFLKREQITDIYLVNDVSCSFIEDTINGKKEFGLQCEKQFRDLFKKFSSEFEQLYVNEKKELLARSNILTQLEYLNQNSLLKDEASGIDIKAHGIITDKKRGFEILN